MNNLREAFNSALIVGGLIGMGSGTVGAVRTVLSPEVWQIPAITQELRNDFQVGEECIGFGPAVPICHDVADKSLSPEQAEEQITLFRRELENRTESINRAVNSQLPLDLALILGGGAAVGAARREKK